MTYIVLKAPLNSNQPTLGDRNEGLRRVKVPLVCKGFLLEQVDE